MNHLLVLISKCPLTVADHKYIGQINKVKPIREDVDVEQTLSADKNINNSSRVRDERNRV